MTTAAGYLIIAALYLKGDNLEPSTVTQILGINPSRSQKRGEKRENKYLNKTGLWALIAQSESQHLQDHFDGLLSQLSPRADKFGSLAGVEEAYFDILMLKTADENGEGKCEFELSAETVSALSKFAIPIRFTGGAVRESVAPIAQPERL